VAPGDSLTLYLVGRAGDCAYGPAFSLENASEFGFQGRSSVRIAYSVAGLTAESEVTLPVIVAEPLLGNCPPD